MGEKSMTSSHANRPIVLVRTSHCQCTDWTFLEKQQNGHDNLDSGLVVLDRTVMTK